MNIVRSLAGLYGPSIPKVANDYAVSVSTTGGLILAADVVSIAAGSIVRTSVSFHNPCDYEIYIAKARDKYGNPIPIIAKGAGTYKLPSGETWIFDAPGPLAWNGIAVGAVGALTILEYLS